MPVDPRPDRARTGESRWCGLPLALGLAVLSLALALLQLHSHYAGLLNTRVSQSAARAALHTPVLRRASAFFIAAQLLLHLLYGVAVWLAARLTLATWPATRMRLRWLVLGWFAASWLLISCANAVRYPWSAASPWARTVLDAVAGTRWLPGVLASLIVALLAGQLAALLWRSRWRRVWLRVAVWGGLLWLVAAVHAHLPRSGSDLHAAQRSPNVVLIGIDSLRTDVIGTDGAPGYMPNLTAFLQQGQVFTDAITPLARTFPAWIALLTGREPVRTGVRENLMPRTAIHAGPTLADRLRAAGYRTVFATDEVRFSNIDATYGFDRTLSPRIGSTDFLLGTLNDVPLANLLANTRVAQWLFPDTYANRAAAVTYEPETFIDRVAAGLPGGAAPLFLATHLTLPHWPYHWAADGDAVFSNTQQQPYSYLASVVEVDRQFGQLLALLERRGVLDHAIVIVFSDHGEGLGLPSDNLLYSPAAKAAVGRLLVWMHGHGTSVLSPRQYHIVLGARSFGVNAANAAPAVHRADTLAIQDIAPTVVDLLGLPVAAGEYDGLSFAARLRSGGSVPPIGVDRIRFTETAYSTSSLGRGAGRAEDMVAEAGLFFRVNEISGRLEADMGRWGELLRLRERAAIGRNLLLAATPGRQAGTHNYIAVSRAGGMPRRLLRPPAAGDDPELRALWRALHAHFPGELGAPAQE
ncbi:MAG: sulfatase-like hydrolase/transferase [Gammaproteobacteria bacterium]|nr:sulfatase-like hydrolase/transferase [Gammaproteobacteria bacterium]